MLLAVVAALLAGCSPGSDPREEGDAAAGGADLRDLDALTIPDLQSMMDDGELTAVQLTQAYLDRIAEHDDEVGAVLTLNPDALAAAQASDDARADGGARSPLEGIPVLLKDNVDTADLPTTAGSRLLLDSRPDDATITARLLDAGAVVIGKAKLSEWANFRGADSTSGWSGTGGQTANPTCSTATPAGPPPARPRAWRPGSRRSRSAPRPTARSSARRAPTASWAQAHDRAGLRDGIVPISAEQDTAGPIARHAVDAALLMAVVAGPDDADDATSRVPDGTDTGFADLDLDACRARGSGSGPPPRTPGSTPTPSPSSPTRWPRWRPRARRRCRWSCPTRTRSARARRRRCWPSSTAT